MVGCAGDRRSQSVGPSWDHVTCHTLAGDSSGGALLHHPPPEIPTLSHRGAGESCELHQSHVAAPERDDQRGDQRRHDNLPQAVLWIPFTAGCPQSQVASATQSTLTAQIIPPGSRTWHSAGYHLTPRCGWHKLGAFDSSQWAGPLPKEHRAPELSHCWEQHRETQQGNDWLWR